MKKIDWAKTAKTFAPFGIVVSVGVILDQLTKAIARNALQYEGNSLPFINGLFEWQLRYNPGAAFSFLEGQMVFFYIVTVVVLVGVIYLYYTAKSAFARLCLALIFSGAVGNFIDRLYAQEVTDFIRFLPFDFPIFNVADMILVSGTIGLLYYYLFLERKHEA